jgi:hypothetical protein
MMRSSESSPFAVLIVRFLNLDAWDLPGADEFRGVVYANLFDEELPGHFMQADVPLRAVVEGVPHPPTPAFRPN